MTNEEALFLVNQKITKTKKELRKGIVRITSINVGAFVVGALSGTGVSLVSFPEVKNPGFIMVFATMGAVGAILTVNLTKALSSASAPHNSYNNALKRKKLKFLRDLKSSIKNGECESFDNLDTEEFNKKLSKI